MTDRPADGSPYRGYAYAYPHKTAYRPLDPPVPLREAWAGEDTSALSLYVHVPFCGMRCGFCNLFTQAKPQDTLVEVYLDALERQLARVAEALPAGTRFARYAVGGGTPTYLSAPQLERLFDAVERHLGARPGDVPSGVEVSPETVSDDRLAVLRERGFSRVSMGVQSFLENETRDCGRPQDPVVLHDALCRVRRAGFPVRNLDLIYGLPYQTRATWDESLSQTLRYEPEEVYLYPLYVRPLTALGRSDKEWDDDRVALYRAGRDRLLAAGYAQVSMRAFRLASLPDDGGPAYCCQSDGMAGVGCGARSYTRSLHYSCEYAVGAKGVREILRDWVARGDDRFALTELGFRLDAAEQRRRWLVQSLLPCAGLDRTAYRARFGADVLTDFPELRELEADTLATVTPERITLTAAGVERSDAVGPWLYSSSVRRLMGDYAWR